MRKSMWLIAFLIAVVASNAHADSLTDPNGTLIFPDGSVITSDIYYASTPANGYDGFTSITFQFPGGTGSALNETSIGAGESGSLVFTEPISNVSVDWEDSYGIYMNFFSYDYGELGSYTEPICTTITPCGGVVSFVDPGSFEMTWTTNQLGYDVSGYGGISAMTYTITPEPGTGVLLLTGIAAIMVTRKRTSRIPRLETITH